MKLLRRDNGSVTDISYIHIKSKNWNDFCNRIEQETGLYIDSASKHSRDGWLLLFDGYGNNFEAEYTKYFDGEYEFRGQNLAFTHMN